MTDYLPSVESIRLYIRTTDVRATSYAMSEYRNARALLVAFRIVQRLVVGDGTAAAMDRLIDEEFTRLRASGGLITTGMIADERKALDRLLPERGRLCARKPSSTAETEGVG